MYTMPILTSAYMFIPIFMLIVSLCALFALPMIWYHAGHISRKLDKIISLMEKNK